MSREEEYQRKADALLKMATGQKDMNERSRLIQDAVHWHNLAMEEHELSTDVATDDRGRADEARA